MLQLMFRSARHALLQTAAKFHWASVQQKEKSHAGIVIGLLQSHYCTWETCSTAFTFTLNDLEMKDTIEQNKQNRLMATHDGTVKPDSYLLHGAVFCDFLLLQLFS